MPKSTKTMQSTTTRTRARASKTTLAPSSAPQPLPQLTHADIANRAYQLFLANGAVHGRDLEHWLQAESELRDRTVSAAQ